MIRSIRKGGGFSPSKYTSDNSITRLSLQLISSQSFQLSLLIHELVSLLRVLFSCHRPGGLCEEAAESSKTRSTSRHPVMSCLALFFIFVGHTENESVGSRVVCMQLLCRFQWRLQYDTFLTTRWLKAV